MKKQQKRGLVLLMIQPAVEAQYLFLFIFIYFLFLYIYFLSLLQIKYFSRNIKRLINYTSFAVRYAILLWNTDNYNVKCDVQCKLQLQCSLNLQLFVESRR
jgi:hypothetical protein